jgi:hypothetical protein
MSTEDTRLFSPGVKVERFARRTVYREQGSPTSCSRFSMLAACAMARSANSRVCGHSFSFLQPSGVPCHILTAGRQADNSKADSAAKCSILPQHGCCIHSTFKA